MIRIEKDIVYSVNSNKCIGLILLKVSYYLYLKGFSHHPEAPCRNILWPFCSYRADQPFSYLKHVTVLTLCQSFDQSLEICMQSVASGVLDLVR